MQKPSSRVFLFLSLIFSLVLPLAAIGADAGSSSADTGIQYPREVATPQGRIIVHAPQIESWTRYEQINGDSALEVTLTGMSKPALGTVNYTGSTVTDLEQGTVTFYSLNLNTVTFPQADAEQAKELEAFVRKTIDRTQLTLPIELVLQYLNESIIPTGAKGLLMTPPVIFYSTGDSRLLMFDGPPMLAPITKTDLQFTVNTNWDLFYIDSTATWYLLDGKRWLSSDGKKFTGEWQSVDSLPDEFKKLPATPNWIDVKNTLPATASSAPLPEIFMSEVPAELILIDGEPKLAAIADTGISYVTNTQADLFLYDDKYYFLVSGRWFVAKKLGTKWSQVNKLPDSFATIPADHPRGDVLVAVPGTDESKLAILEANIPRKAEISRQYVPPVTVAYADGQPKFERLAPTQVYRAVNTEYVVLQSESKFYLCYNAAWFVSDHAVGPWQVADQIPQEIYSIPVDASAYNCTHVYVYESDNDKVTTGYDSGYFNVYTSYSVMYGTGYYYYPYYNYPYYYGYPRSYGEGAWYNPKTGNYGVGQTVNGPYGGASRVAVYNPETGTYGRGRAVWDGDEIARQGVAYNPSTGTGVYTQRYANEDGAWGQSLVKRDDKWIATQSKRDGDSATVDFKTSGGASGTTNREMNDGVMSGSGEISKGDQTVDTEMRRTEDGVARKFTDEQGNSSGYVRNSEGDLYAGKDGEVYKREDGEWSKHGEDGWDPVEREQGAGGDYDLQRSDIEAARGQGEKPTYRDMGGLDNPSPNARQPSAQPYDPSRDNINSMPDYSSERERNQQRESSARQLDRQHDARREGFNQHASRSNRGAARGGRRGGGRRR